MENVSIETSMSLKPVLKRRSRFSFSLRTMLIFFAVVAALLHFWIIPSERQRIACEEIIAGRGYFDLSELDIPNRRPGLYPPQPTDIKWYHHYFYHVDRVALRNPTQVTWDYLPKLEALEIVYDKSFGEMLKNNPLPKLVVDISIHSQSSMSTDVIDSIAHCKNLESLKISGKIYVRDENKLRSLLELSKLKKLHIELVVLKPKDSSLQPVFDMIEQIKGRRPDFAIGAMYLRTD